MRESGKKNTTAKERRLAAALRENLKRRKTQARARAGSAASVARAKPHDSAGIDADE
jgi:hypothetical protein